MKEFLKKLKINVLGAAEVVGEKASELTEISKFELKIKKKKNEIKKVKSDLGELVYKNHEQDIVIDDEVDNICKKIDKKYNELQKLKKDLKSFKENNEKVSK